MSEEWNGRVQQGSARVSYSTSTSPVDMSFPISRSSAPGSLAPFRFGSRSDSSQSRWNGKESADGLSDTGVRRASTQSNPKGKDPAYDEEHNGHTSPTTNSFGFGSNEMFASSRYKPSYEPSRPSKADVNSKKNRGSLLVAASDALGFRFGRRRPIIRQPPMPIILPDVIEISAPPPRDEEDEERDRLRDMAAQSIGLHVVVKPDNHSLHDSVEEVDEEAEAEEEEEEEEEEEGNNDTVPLPDNEKHDSSNIVPRSPQESSHSIIVPTSPLITNRFRSRSVVHSRTNSISLTAVPQFPATFNVIDQFQQAGTMLYKYYQPSSLRIFALSKNWRHRFMVLSAPTAFATRNSGPPVSYLHLFKSSVGEEKEMERLEINEDSVVFVAEEDVGGRKHVVKVGGKDVGAMKKELNHEEGGRTMWFLHITDPAEAQKWITVIKNAILGQRTVRAGLGLPTSTLGGVEPRGDMDVMLSMRAQGLITSPTAAVIPRPPENGSQASSDRNYASSISSYRSQATVARSVSSGAVSTLKGLFTGSTRPRSTSRATSIDSQQDRDPKEDSFGSMGNHLLAGRRSNIVDGTLGTHPVTTHASLPFSGSVLSPEHRLERKIAVDRPIQWASTSTIEPTPVNQERANRTLSLGALSLQPPPRKRWTSAGPARPGPETVVIANGDAAASPDIATPEKAETEPLSSPTMAGFTFGTPEQRPRAPSIHSVSTLASAENNVERSSSSTKRSSMKRWSRQGNVLPRRLTPPSGPPPSVPATQTIASRGGRLSVDGGPNRSRSSSTHSTASQKSFVSSLPSFSKRASGSSVLSTSSISQSPVASRPGSAHRMSMPPPRPAPTSALPPAPDQDLPKLDSFPSPSSSKPSFRDSVAHRAFRLSMVAPKPPPSGVLPPRPDEIQPKSHRRNSSAGSYSHPTSLSSIPASPVPPPVAVSPPFPPPMGPLPPTPISPQPATTNTTPTQSRPTSRHVSIRQRLRILSAPSAASPPSVHSTSAYPPTDQLPNGTAAHRRPRPATSLTTVPVSPPATPIAEKIMVYQNDSSFLQLHTPVMPHLPPRRALPIPPEPEIISLSPPPRRGSKQISVVGSDVESPSAEDEKPAVEGEHRLMSLSRPGSVISLGIMSV